MWADSQEHETNGGMFLNAMVKAKVGSCYVELECSVATEMRTISGHTGKAGAVKSDRSTEGSQMASVGHTGIVCTRSKLTKSNHTKYELWSLKCSSVKQLVLVSNYYRRITPRP